MTDILRISSEIIPRWMARDLADDGVNIVSCKGLMPPGDRPLPEQMLTRIYVAMWRH